MKNIPNLFINFFQNEKSGGIVLILATLASVILANSGAAGSYIHFWETNLAGHSITHWINDGLMAIFFLMIGLELEREVYIGELSNFKEATLPIMGALGGILVPAGIYLLLNAGTQNQNGAGIPMATDIAFALGVLLLLGSRVPTALKVFLTALAVIDDLCAILVIAIFYSKGIDVTNLFISLGFFVALLILNRMKVYFLLPYIIGGVAMWYFMLNSGVHATISGVLLAFAMPFQKGEEGSLSYKLQNWLHFPVVFLILPLFALANTAIPITGTFSELVSQKYTLGIGLGLLLGKPLGVSLFSWLSVKLKWASLPKGIQWKQIIGVGILAGIGFTMSIFITMLAFTEAVLINNSKLIILISSLLAGIIGFYVLKMILPKQGAKELSQ